MRARKMGQRSRRLGVALAIGAGWLTARPAAAGDGMRLRTPVQWSDAACMTIVDRSVESVVHLPYDIPFEESERTDDEVADGRTHQFFALCRGHDPTELLPVWISESDVAAAEALALIDLDTITGDAILELDPRWQGCAQRIVLDDERRPITFAAAAEGVDWETAGLPAGAWVVEGFTHDPAYSIWSPRPGVFKLVDAPARDARQPAVAVLNDEIVVQSGETVAIEGCVSAMAGTVLQLRWAAIGEVVDDEAWPVAVEAPVEGDAFSLPLSLPDSMAGRTARVRVDAEDPQGRRARAFMGQRVIVLPMPPGGCDEGCDSSGGATSQGDGSSDDQGDVVTSSSDTGPEPAVSTGGGDDGVVPGSTGSTRPSTPALGADDGGCRCASTSARRRGRWSWLWLWLGLGRWRRRRSPRADLVVGGDFAPASLPNRNEREPRSSTRPGDRITAGSPTHRRRGFG